MNARLIFAPLMLVQLVTAGCASQAIVPAPKPVAAAPQKEMAVLPQDQMKPGEMDFDLAPRAKAAQHVDMERALMDPACHPTLTTKGSHSKLVGVGNVEQ
jgi:hypothetical protein